MYGIHVALFTIWFCILLSYDSGSACLYIGYCGKEQPISLINNQGISMPNVFEVGVAPTPKFYQTGSVTC